KSRIIAANFGGAVQCLERLFFFAGRNLDFAQALISLDVAWIKRDRLVGIIDRLISFLKIFGINKRELKIRIGPVGVGLDGIFQNIDRLRKVILPREQDSYSRGAFGLAGID